MRAFRPIKTNIIRMMILIKYPSIFSAWSTVTIPVGRWGPWTHGIIVEPNGSDHRIHSYTIQVTKIGRRITYNVKPIWPTTISAEQYLWKQIKKVNRMVGRCIHAGIQSEWTTQAME